MEIATLTAFLSPFLPTLLKLGGKAVEKATESASGKFGEAAFKKAEAVWAKLSPKVEAKEAAKEAAINVANSPENEDSQAALRVQLKKLLEQDEELMKAIEQILKEDAPDGTSGTQIVQNVTGNRNQVIGQMTNNTTFSNITGNIDSAIAKRKYIKDYGKFLRMTDYAKVTLPEDFPIDFITALAPEILLKTSLFNEIEETPSQSNRDNLLTRYSNLDCPDTTQLDIAFSIYAQLLIKPPDIASKSLEIEDTASEFPQIEVVLRARSFDVEGSNTQIMEVERDDDSEVRFVLTPRQLGAQQIRVDFYQHGKPISTIRHNILVGESQSSYQISQPDRDPIIELKVNSNISPPDLEICIELDRHNDRILYFELHSIKEKIDYNHAKLGQINLKGSPLEKMKAVYEELSAFAAIQPRKFQSQDPTSDRSTDRDSQKKAEQRIALVGNKLWDALIPNEFKEEYWKFKAKGVKSILITSEEPWVPWEIIKPYRFYKNKEEQDPFWCEQFAISRWLSGGGTADELPIKLVIPVAPNFVNLPAVAAEIKFLEQLNVLYPDIQIVPQIDRSLDLQAYLKKQPDFSLLHFACHGGFNNTLPDDSAIQLSGNDCLRPSDIHIHFEASSSRPIVFINACDGGRQGYSFTELGGWAKCLVEARVGAFVGAMWEVNDTLALEFAKHFYQALLQDKKTIGEAFQQARAVIRTQAPYNSTWLAYTLYADPEARLAKIVKM